MAKKAKLPTKKVSLTDCLDMVFNGKPLYDSATDGALANTLRLEKDAALNFELRTYKTPATITPSYTTIDVVPISPAAIHYAGEIHGEKYVSQQLLAAIQAGKQTPEFGMEFTGAYDNFHLSGDNHASFHKWEVVPYLMCAVTVPELRAALLAYPLTRSRDGKAREVWFETNEALLDTYFEKPLELREERVLAKLVNWCFVGYPNKLKEKEREATRIRHAEIAAKARAEANRLPGDNVLTMALKKVNLVPVAEPA